MKGLLQKEIFYFVTAPCYLEMERAMALFYKVEMQHTEESFKALAHMQYDLFCGSNRVARTVISLVLMVVGVINFSAWWGILLVAYGCYLTTSTYVSANRTANKLSEQIKNSGNPFPASCYEFREEKMDIIRLPERVRDSSLAYADIRRVGEDIKYFYIFRDEFGGYMIPKEALGQKTAAFRTFLEGKAGQTVRDSKIPIVRLIRWLRRRRKSKSNSNSLE